MRSSWPGPVIRQPVGEAKQERIYMVYMRRAELLTTQRATIVRLRADRHHDPVDAALAG
jgi:hypothetical protein